MSKTIDEINRISRATDKVKIFAHVPYVDGTDEDKKDFMELVYAMNRIYESVSVMRRIADKRNL